MKKLLIVALVVVMAAMFSFPGILFGSEYVFPSTNEDNINGTNTYRDEVIGPHVKLISAGIGEVTLNFVMPENYIAGFEYRSDGDTSQSTNSEHHNPYISDDLYIPVVVGAESSSQRTIAANEYVEVRLTFGGERDWDFDWTKFYPKSTYGFSYDISGLTFLPNTPINVPISLQAQTIGHEGFDLVIIEVEVDGPGSAQLLATDSAGTEFDLAAIGYWGPSSGFPISKDYSSTTDVTAIFDTTGTYTITLKLLDLGGSQQPASASTKGENDSKFRAKALAEEIIVISVSEPTSPAPPAAPAVEVEGITEEVEVLGVESVRTKPLTVWQVDCNDEGHLEFIFVYPYKDNNWLTIYDMAGNEVYREDISYSNPRTVVDLPDGMYTVKTFRSEGHIIQEFTIGLPCGVAVEGVAELPRTGADYLPHMIGTSILIAGLASILFAFRKRIFKSAVK